MTRLARYLDLPDPGFPAVLAWVLALRKEIGIPHTLADLGVKESDLDTLVPEAVDDPSTGGNPRPAGAPRCARCSSRQSAGSSVRAKELSPPASLDPDRAQRTRGLATRS